MAFPESETFRFNLEEISSGSPTTHSELSLPDYKAFPNFPPAGRSDFNHEEFADELTHIMSLPNLECFKFKIEPDQGDLTSINPGIRKNVSTTNVNVPLEDDQSSLFAYVVWIFLAFLTYPVVPPYRLSTRNEDTIFDPGISMIMSFMPDDFPDCEDSLACSISQEFHILSFILGIQERGLALEAQTAAMASASNPNRNTRPREIPCAEEDRVTFAIGTLTDDALSLWNAYAQPMGIEQANQITWTELKRLLTNKYCPRTEIKKMEDEFYGLTVNGKSDAQT
ncbi:hypothetical protein Tco_1226162 [Tanacetum coccineum]